MTRRFFASSTFLLSAAGFALAQATKAKKSFTFRGKIESMDAASKTMSVNGEKVEGWMDAMSMKYKVDNADVFQTAKVGDTIEATVYEGDYVLYKTHVIPSPKK
jgi:Cu/Ag efflux protein CusF